ncbi:MAG: Eco47II family restriction endonuclease [Saprospiraceae bacterium]|nr:Eco47II family restriction endonuclease [Saprospiraceae bacterium]
MPNKYVQFITDDHLLTCIDNLYSSYQKARNNINRGEFYKNKIDTVKMIFDKYFGGQADKDLIEGEVIRKANKTISNAIGTFHEEILGGINGYIKGNNSGYDIKASNNSIFIELKNKWNTLKGEDKPSIFRKLESFIQANPGAKGYYARIWAKKSEDKIWEFTAKQQSYKNDNIHIISGDKLYAMLTKRPKALFELYQALPKAINDYLTKIGIQTSKVQSDLYSEINHSAEETKRELIDQISKENYDYYDGFDSL